MIKKTMVQRCYCTSEQAKHWRVISPLGYVSYWATWKRAMLRATRGI